MQNVPSPAVAGQRNVVFFFYISNIFVKENPPNIIAGHMGPMSEIKGHEIPFKMEKKIVWMNSCSTFCGDSEEIVGNRWEILHID